MSICFIPGIYPCGVSLLIAIHFGVPTVNFGPLGINVSPKMKFQYFLRNELLAQFIWYLVFYILGCVSWPLFDFVFLLWIAALWCLIFAPKQGFQICFVTPWLSNGQNNAGFFSESNILYTVFYLCSSHNDSKIGVFVWYFWIKLVAIRARVQWLHLWPQLASITWLFLKIYVFCFSCKG